MTNWTLVMHRSILYICAALALLVASPSQTIADQDDDAYNAFSQPPASTRMPVGPSAPTQFSVDLSPQQPATPPLTSSSPHPVLDGLLDQAAKKLLNHLTGRDLAVLSSRDVIVLVDKSGSMSTKDCPPPGGVLRFILHNGGDTPGLITRWQWCEEQLAALSRDADAALPGGIRLVLFDNRQITFDHIGLGQISEIFHRNNPGGGTHEAEAVKSQLDWYFHNRELRNGNVRPVVIAVITDGLPNSPSALKRVLIDATRQMKGPGEVAVTFLQIGNDRKGMALVHDLSDNLLHDGAIYPIAHCKDFNEVSSEGLARALVDAINGSGTAIPYTQR